MGTSLAAVEATGGLDVQSKVLLLHLRSLDRRHATRLCGDLAPEAMTRVETALRIATGLTRV